MTTKRAFTMNWVPDDFHLHLRRATMLEAVLHHTAKQFGRGLIMPNTRPQAILTGDHAAAYQAEIMRACGAQKFQPLMAIQITPQTTPEIVFAAKKAGAVAGKTYPKDMTTHSDNGITDYRALGDVFAAMQECGMLWLAHGEMATPRTLRLDYEENFLPTLKMIAALFPKLRIVLEHVSSAAAINCVSSLGPNVAATITAHHLYLTLNDLIGQKLRPHNFCHPIAKRFEDRCAIVHAAVSGNPKFFFGSDSAPHSKDDKECSECCAGVFTAPHAMELLVQLFEQQGTLGKLEDFCSKFGTEFYGLPRTPGEVTFGKTPWNIPTMCEGGVVPFKAGEILAWKLLTKFVL